MALTNFDSTTPVTAGYLNDLVNRLPRTAVLARSSKESEGSANSTAFVEIARLKMRPVQGDYLHIDYEAKSEPLGGTVRTVFEYLGGQLGAQDDVFTSTSYARASRSVNLSSVSGNDLTCQDVDLVFYGKKPSPLSPATYIRSILVISSDQASAASVGQ